MDNWPRWWEGQSFATTQNVAWTAPFNLAQLPVELWEIVIDAVASDPHLNRSLRDCSLVCRSWVTRCRYHLCRRVVLASSDSLTFFAQFIKSSPDFPGRVEQIRVDGSFDNPTSWISHFPVSLPRMPNLNCVVFTSIDLTEQNVHFWRFLTLLPCRTLKIQGVLYSQHPQISRLVSAIQPRTFTLGGAEPVGHASHPPQHHARTCGKRFQDLHTIAVGFKDWEKSVAFMQGWIYFGPLLRSIQILVGKDVHQWLPPFQGETISVATFTSGLWPIITRIFQPPCRLDEALSVSVRTTFAAFILRRSEPRSDRSPPIAKRLEQDLCVEFNKFSLHSHVVPVIAILSVCTFDSVTLKLSPIDWRKLDKEIWKLIDVQLSGAHFPVLNLVMIENANAVSGQLLDDGEPPLSDTDTRCSKDIFSEAFPECVAKGILRSACSEWAHCRDHAVPPYPSIY
ncbi:hypothetical protein BXZ70DRAFT_486189 [Cristinia sonorae]|uniref:F-box domain-containing protein n=1 Tax=Cristinia sonorae TaxID=1940300 RepID=A0A8K0UIC6_9AGAR|nr:hypothetical protein BXZ70DRAFT_486189 [Cristinia sonorae]